MIFEQSQSPRPAEPARGARSLRRRAVVAVAFFAAMIALPLQPPASAAPSILQPARLLDTRAGAPTADGQFRGQGKVVSGSTLRLKVAGRGGVTQTPGAVALNLTATNVSSDGYLTLYACDAQLPTASSLNFQRGQTVANLAVTGLSASGEVCIYAYGSADVIVDVSAVFPTSDFTALRPGRLLDTRPAPTIDSKFSGAGAVAANSTTRLLVTGRAGVPAGATSVALNLTSAEASSGYLTAFECGVPLPTASNLNYSPGVTVANMATVKVSASGEVCLYSSSPTHLIVDVTGYFTANGLHTVVPGRLADTRPGTPTVDGQNSGTGLRPTGGTLSLQVTGRAAVPATASAVMLNVTSANSRADGGYLTAYAAGGGQPGTSNLNYSTGRVVANSAIVQVGVSGKVCLFTYGATDLIVDVVGWFDGPVPPSTGASCPPDPTAPLSPGPTNPIPAAQLPQGIAGSDQVLIQSSAQQGESADVSGNFRFICGMSHMAYDDPIVFPGQPGRSHLHVFFGNTGTNASSTYDTLRNSGNGTCSGGIANRSSYWMPALMNAGVPVVPDYLQVYYKSGYRKIAPSQINNVPNGLRIVAGASTATTDQSPEIVEWYCTNASGVDEHMTNCGAGAEMQMGIIFPQCWDGVNLDSADHKSHMAYPGSGSNFGAGCPASHPVAIPVITMTQFFHQPAGTFTNLRLSSDPAGAPAGVSSHADYFEAWDPTIRDGWTQHCVREHRDCTRGLGDARQLVDPSGL